MAATSMTVRASGLATGLSSVSVARNASSRTAAVTSGFSTSSVKLAGSRKSVRVMAMSEDVKDRKPSPLEVGGTLSGDKAAGKDAAPATLAAMSGAAVGSMDFNDSRWVKGNWDLAQFSNSEGEVDWDLVIDAEINRRAKLEAQPAELDDFRSDSLVSFDTGVIPWWAWVKRFHLPEAELVNGRAAMVGYASSYLVDALTGVGLVDQTSSFLGKTMIFLTVLGVVFVRKTEDIDNLKGLIDEATFYDRQWQATWDGVDRPSETEK